MTRKPKPPSTLGPRSIARLERSASKVPNSGAGRLRDFDEADLALLDVVARLADSGYAFTTITPASHARVLDRRTDLTAASERDVFGWSLPFGPGLLSADLENALQASGMAEPDARFLRSKVRVSKVRDQLYLHSAYPTIADDAVFLGPDSYRFANLIADELTRSPPPKDAHVVDIGIGAGVGLLTAAAYCTEARLVGTDVNAQALRFARMNAAAAGVALRTIETNGLESVEGTFDLALLNPPYIIDQDARAYRHGGGMHGGEVSLALASAALARLAPDGRLILYTGSAIVDGDDALRTALARTAETHGCAMRYWELDPDVFGEELSNPQYRAVERIALVAAVFTKSG